jgi:voltage-gated potassium channel Kch
MTPHPLRDIASAYLALLRAIGVAFRQQHVILLLALTIFVATSGAVVMMVLEGWGFIDALYFAVVSMATVGYGDFSPETPAGKIFTMGFLVIGIGIFVLTVGAIAEAILSAMPKGRKAED